MLWQKVGLFNGYLMHFIYVYFPPGQKWSTEEGRKKNLEGRKISSSSFKINWCSLSKLLYGRKPCKKRISMNHYAGELQLLKWMKLVTPNGTVMYWLWNLHLLYQEVNRVQSVSYNTGKNNCNNGKIYGPELFNFINGYFNLLRNSNLTNMNNEYCLRLP